MKRRVLVVLCCLLALGCKKNEESAINVLLDVNLADGTYNWFVNADDVGSNVANFENAKNSLKFSLTRAVEIPEEEKWTWSEIMIDSVNADWSKFSGIEITYRADKNLSVILMDDELEQSDAAAGFFAVLPVSQNDTTVTLKANEPKHFKQHEWVHEQFPDIRKTIDNSKLYGIKIGTKAMGETTDAVISKFVLKGVYGYNLRR